MHASGLLSPLLQLSDHVALGLPGDTVRLLKQGPPTCLLTPTISFLSGHLLPLLESGARSQAPVLVQPTDLSLKTHLDSASGEEG